MQPTMQFRATFKAEHAMLIQEEAVKRLGLPYGAGNLLLLGYNKAHDWDNAQFVVPYNLIKGDQPVDKLWVDTTYDLILQSPVGKLADRLKISTQGLDTTLLYSTFPEGTMHEQGLSTRFVDASYDFGHDHKKLNRFLTDLCCLYINEADADAFRKDAERYKKEHPEYQDRKRDPKLYRIVSMEIREQGRR